MLDKKSMMQLERMKFDLCRALGVGLSEVEVVLLPPVKPTRTDPLVQRGLFGASLFKGRKTARGILFTHYHPIRLSSAVGAIVSAPQSIWARGDARIVPILLMKGADK